MMTHSLLVFQDDKWHKIHALRFMKGWTRPDSWLVEREHEQVDWGMWRYPVKKEEIFLLLKKPMASTNPQWDQNKQYEELLKYLLALDPDMKYAVEYREEY